MQIRVEVRLFRSGEQPLSTLNLRSALGCSFRRPSMPVRPSIGTAFAGINFRPMMYERLPARGEDNPPLNSGAASVESPPPVPGVERRNNPDPNDLTSLLEAHACFRGIERPLAEDDDGANVIAYVLRPRFLYEYDPNMVSLALRVPVPRDLVFITYARLLELSGKTDEPVGVITHWGFVEADPHNLRLPINSSTRYRERLW